jgi:hypothetical protein
VRENERVFIKDFSLRARTIFLLTDSDSLSEDVLITTSDTEGSDDFSF